MAVKAWGNSNSAVRGLNTGFILKTNIITSELLLTYYLINRPETDIQLGKNNTIL